jgi:hypothetical protein
MKDDGPTVSAMVGIQANDRSTSLTPSSTWLGMLQARRWLDHLSLPLSSPRPSTLLPHITAHRWNAAFMSNAALMGRAE